MISLASIRFELRKLGVKCPKEKTLQTILKQQEHISTLPRSKIFGINLSEHEVTADSDQVPLFLVLITAHLLTYAQDVGLFRKAGSVKRQRVLRAELESGGRLEGSEPNDVAALLKQWLRELPVPVIPHCLHDVFAKCQNLKENRDTAIFLACLLLPPVHLQTLKHLLSFLARVSSNSSTNKMNPINLAVVMAPNIFVLGRKNVDKHSSTIIQLHTSAIEFLIKNATLIGSVPVGVTLQPQGILDLDSSGDLLVCSPCRSKRRKKSGGVQDLINGIRKLRRGTNASNSKTPEGILGASKLPQKHKADNEDLSPSIKRQAVCSDMDFNLNATPISKGNPNLLTANGRNDRRSFGLLRKNRSKHRPKPSTFQTNESSIERITDKNSVVQVLEKLNDPKQENKSPSILEILCPVTRSESIKKSASDSLLRPLQKDFAQSIALSSSQNCLNGGASFSSCFRHQTVIHEPGSLFLEIQSTLESREKNRKQEIMNRDSATELIITATSNLLKPIKSSESELMILNSKRSSLDKVCMPLGMKTSKSSCVSSSKSKRTSGREIIETGGNTRALRHKKNENSASIKSKCEDSENAAIFSDLVSLAKDLSLLVSPDLDSNISNVRGTRQDGFILKSIKHRPKNAADVTKNLNSDTSQVTPKITVEHNSKKGTSSTALLEVPSERKVTSKTSRKGSIIRGRPNTIKSGLNSDLCKHLNSMNRKGKEINYTNKENLDTSLTQKFINFGITSPNTIQELHSAFGIDYNISFIDASLVDSSPKKSSKSKKIQRNSEASTRLESSKKRLSRTTNISDSKIPRLKLSLGSEKSSSLSDSDFIIAEDLSPFVLKTRENSRRSSLLRSNLPENRVTKIPTPTRTPETRKPTLSEATPDVFKTPSTHFKLSPNWTPAREFLESPGSLDHESTSKRESIAMILRKKHGHVQAKVSLYDNIAKPKVSGSKSLSLASTPGDENGKMLRTYSQKNTPLHKADSRSVVKKPISGTSSSTKAKTRSVNSPLPPPPKFISSNMATSFPELVDKTRLPLYGSLNKNTQPRKDAEKAAGASSPKSALKEVTNIDSSFDSSPYNKKSGKNKIQNGLIANENTGLSLPDKNKLRCKRKTNSFSGHMPNKLSKQVLRSESSPLILRSRITYLRMKESKNLPQVENALTMLKVNYS